MTAWHDCGSQETSGPKWQNQIEIDFEFKTISQSYLHSDTPLDESPYPRPAKVSEFRVAHSFPFSKQLQTPTLFVQ
jgi:hypothetical protein